MKRHLLLTMLLLVAVSLLIPSIYATTTNQQNTEIITNTSISQNNNTVNIDKTVDKQSKAAAGSAGAVNSTKNSPTSSQSKTNSNSPKNSSQNQNTAIIQYANAAAGDSNVQNNWFTNKKITEAAGRVKTFIETNHKLPNYVTIGTTKVTMPQFLKLLTTGLIQVNKGTTTQIKLTSVSTPTKTSESLKSGNIGKTEYLNIASRIQSYINTNGRAPNYATSSLGKIGFQSAIYMYSKILGYHDKNKVLPSTVSMKS
ncbi:MAG TPA: pseudomurein-binding repeat-containing protein, partial [Methanobacterium sp.]